MSSVMSLSSSCLASVQDLERACSCSEICDSGAAGVGSATGAPGLTGTPGSLFTSVKLPDAPFLQTIDSVIVSEEPERKTCPGSRPVAPGDDRMVSVTVPPLSSPGLLLNSLALLTVAD